MDSGEVFALIAAERRRAADMFDGLRDEQWAAQSLCAEWTVRDVAAHLIGPFCISVPRFLAGALLSGGFHTYSVKATRRLAQRPTPEIVAVLRANAERTFVPPGTGPAAPLTDLAVHTRDVARPLGLATTAPASAWRAVLDFLVSARASRGFVRRGRLEGLHLRATDLDWSAGEGPEVTGPGEALALAMTGRVVALADLSGDGVAVLGGRPA
jgi:uncharacterized protein (TIGR03083 family)